MKRKTVVLAGLIFSLMPISQAFGESPQNSNSKELPDALSHRLTNEEENFVGKVSAFLGESKQYEKYCHKGDWTTSPFETYLDGHRIPLITIFEGLLTSARWSRSAPKSTIQSWKALEKGGKSKAKNQIKSIKAEKNPQISHKSCQTAILDSQKFYKDNFLMFNRVSLKTSPEAQRRLDNHLKGVSIFTGIMEGAEIVVPEIIKGNEQSTPAPNSPSINPSSGHEEAVKVLSSPTGCDNYGRCQ